MMNRRQQQHFSAFFQEIYETEQILDFIKQQLSNSRNYNSNLLFELISARTQKITIKQMRTYLEDKVAVNHRELYEIFQRFDWTRQGFISKQDFISEIHPFSSNCQADTQSHGTISAQIEGHFISLIVEILKRFRIMEVTRKQVKYIQPYDAFQQIDYLKLGHLGVGQLRKLFFDNDFNVTDRQLYFLLHGLRRRCYRDITLEVFCQNLNPLEFGRYVAYEHEIDKEKERQLQNQNRREEQTMRRSRVQSQRIQHEFQKAQRKKQAEVERQLELQSNASVEIFKYEEEKQRQIRRALMQEDKTIRHQRAIDQETLRAQHFRNQQQKIENQYLNSRRLQEESINVALAESALHRQEEIQRSRRALERQRSMAYEQEFQRQMLRSSQRAAERQLIFSKKVMAQSNKKQPEPQPVAKIQNQSRKISSQQSSRKKQIEQMPKQQENQTQLKRRYEYDLSSNISDSNVNMKEVQSSRTRYETNRKIEHQSRRIQEQSRRIQEQSRRRYLDNIMKPKYEREQELSKIRHQQYSHPPLSSSKATDYEKQLQRTRYEIQQRRNRRLAEESAKTYR